jgi:hypothetical protein
MFESCPDHEGFQSSLVGRAALGAMHGSGFDTSSILVFGTTPSKDNSKRQINDSRYEPHGTVAIFSTTELK